MLSITLRRAIERAVEGLFTLIIVIHRNSALLSWV